MALARPIVEANRRIILFTVSFSSTARFSTAASRKSGYGGPKAKEERLKTGGT
jgi:hypothetical protein